MRVVVRFRLSTVDARFSIITMRASVVRRDVSIALLARSIGSTEPSSPRSTSIGFVDLLSDVGGDSCSWLTPLQYPHRVTLRIPR